MKGNLVAFKVDMEDLGNLLQMEPEHLNTDAYRQDVQMCLMHFNLMLDAKDWKGAVEMGRDILMWNMMPWAVETKFILCLNMVRCAKKLNESLDTMNSFMELVNNNYHNIGTIEI